MKTIVLNTQKILKAAAIGFIILLIEVSGFAQDSRANYTKNDLYALANSPEYMEINNNPNGELTFIETFEYDEELEIEPWMTEEFIISKLDAENTEVEEELEIEDWMLEFNRLVEVEEPELEIEDWMVSVWVQ